MCIRDRYLDAPLSTNLYQGKYYGLPLDTNCKAAVVNTNVLKELGIDEIPATMEEFIEAAKTRGTYSLNVSGVGDWDMYPYFWLFGGVLDSICRKSGGELNALMRTTVAFTQAKGSAGRNVIPPEATLISNLRLNPEDTMDSALAYLKETIDDPAVKITKLEGMNPSCISETNCPAWDKVASAVAGTWKGCLVSPYLMVQCSDSRHYGRISDHVYRFSAMDLTAEERGTLHGNNERIRVETVGRAVEFYVRLMRQC